MWTLWCHVLPHLYFIATLSYLSSLSGTPHYPGWFHAFAWFILLFSFIISRSFCLGFIFLFFWDICFILAPYCGSYYFECVPLGSTLFGAIHFLPPFAVCFRPLGSAFSLGAISFWILLFLAAISFCCLLGSDHLDPLVVWALLFSGSSYFWRQFPWCLIHFVGINAVLFGICHHRSISSHSSNPS